MLEVKQSAPVLDRYGMHCLAICLLLVSPGAVPAEGGRLIREKVHGASLEKTVSGDSADRWVSVYLPPGYDKSLDKRYPAVYLLHGIGDTDQTWMLRQGPYENIKSLMDRGIEEGRFGAMIVVMPDEQTPWAGSFYTNSEVTGKWEEFTVKDLVAAIDGRYRTLARPESRGVAGHSMGGYGAIKLGMKNPGVFSVVYAMNPAVLGWSGDLSIENQAFGSVLKMTTRDQALAGGIYPIGIICLAQAFSPNANRPPFYADFPFELVDGKLRPSEPAFSKWEDNFPVNIARRHRTNLGKLRGFRLDTGWEDEYTHIPPTSRALSRTLTSLGIEHVFEEYNGNHRNRLWGRAGRLHTTVLPYFWFLLETQGEKPGPAGRP